jgi:hypothetical protein
MLGDSIHPQHCTELYPYVFPTSGEGSLPQAWLPWPPQGAEFIVLPKTAAHDELHTNTGADKRSSITRLHPRKAQ